jgi:DNA-binding transcriptional MocR family regulator
MVVPEGIRNLADGNPDLALLPGLAQAVQQAALAHGTHPVLYGGAALDPGLRAVAEASFADSGVPDAPIGVASGSLDAIERIFIARLRPGDGVAVEDPGWGSLLDLLPALGLKAVPMALDDDGPLPGELARALADGVRAVVVTSRAQNPTGASVTLRRAAELRGLLAAHPEVLLIEDDHGHGIVDLPYYPLCAARDGAATSAAVPTTTTTAAWAVVRSAAKSLGPDLRVAVFTGDAETMDRVRGRQRLGAGWVSHLLQRTVAALWTAEDTAPAAASYRHRRDGLLAELAARGVRGHGRSGLSVWVPVPDETVAVAGLMQRGWAVAAGARFRLGSPPGIRITVSRLSQRDFAPLAEDVAAVLRPQGGDVRGV